MFARLSLYFHVLFVNEGMPKLDSRIDVGYACLC